MDKPAGRPQRRYDIDWVRVLAMVMVFFFHCARFFDEEGWHAKNFEVSRGMTIFVEVVHQWLMPLFFVLSGISSYYALSYISGKKSLGARVKRLVVPLGICSLTHVSLQVYLEQTTQGGFSGSFFAFYPHYFDGFYGFGGNFAWMGLHLWYLEMLFIFSLVTLPLFLWMRSERAENPISRAADFMKKPGALFLLAVPLAVIELLSDLQPEVIGIRAWGGWALFPHLAFFVSGYFLASHSEFRSILEKNRGAALAMGVAATAIGYVLVESGFSTRGPLFSFLRAFNCWFWMTAILGFGSRLLDFNNRVLKYAGEAVLPFYILHQSVIIVIGYFIIDWSAGVMPKYLFLTSTSFITIMVLYELFVRRINAMRFLFGLKSRRSAPADIRPDTVAARAT